MRFIGGKTLLIPYIKAIIQERTSGVQVVGDLFSGSGIVSKEFKAMGLDTVSNDFMYFSYVLLRGSIQLKDLPKFDRLRAKNPVEYLNNLSLNCNGRETSEKFIHNNYSPKGGRMYFTEENALKIDLIRQQIEKWWERAEVDEDEYFYLLACLLEAIPYVSNIAGVYGAYLKHWDARALKPIELKEIPIRKSNTENLVYNRDANDLVRNIKLDLAYLDPPYNQRQYLPNYHILETIAKYDFPKIGGKTGLRDYTNQKSTYCRKSSVLNSFDDLIKNLNSKYIVLSYNTEGLLRHEEIEEVLIKHGKKETYYFERINYLRYKNAQTKQNKELKEVLYFIEKG